MLLKFYWNLEYLIIKNIIIMSIIAIIMSISIMSQLYCPNARPIGIGPIKIKTPPDTLAFDPVVPNCIKDPNNRIMKPIINIINPIVINFKDLS